MINEVELIVWKNPIEEEILYAGDCITAPDIYNPFFIQINPIAGIATSDIIGKYVKLFNSIGQYEYFPLWDVSVNPTTWTIVPQSLDSALTDPYAYRAKYSYLIGATYQIVERTYVGEVYDLDINNYTTTTNPNGYQFGIVGNHSSDIQGKDVYIKLPNGQEWMFSPRLTRVNLGVTQFHFQPAYVVGSSGFGGQLSFMKKDVGEYVDLYPNESISQNWRFTDITNFTNTGGFSREFRIPANETNNRIFGIVENANYFGEIDFFNTKIKAEIRVNSLPIVSGHLRLMKVYTQDGKYSDLQISFYSETPDLMRDIGDLKLKDIRNLRALNHQICYPVVTGAEPLLAYGDINTFDDSFIYVDAEENSGIYAGKILELSNGVTTDTRTITRGITLEGVNPYTSIQFDPPVTEDYTGGTFKVLNPTLFDNVQYALADRGQKWAEDGFSDTRPIYDSINPVYAGDMTPHVNALWIFREIIKNAGYVLNPTPLTSILDSYWITWLNNKSLQTGIDTTGYLFRLQKSTTGDGFGGFTEIYDYNSNVLSGEYYPPFAGYYTFRVWMTFIPANNGQAQTLYCQIRDAYVGAPAGVIYHVHTFSITQEQAIAQEPINVQFVTDPIYFGSNLTYPIRFRAYSSVGTNLTFFGDSVYNPSGATGYELVKIENIPYGADISMNQNAPDVKQVDFIKDILNMHCCAIIPDKFKPKTLSIIPMSDYVNSGDTLDWTDKLDISKDIVLSPTTDKQKKNILFTYKGGGEYLSKLFTDSGRTYGEYKINGYRPNPYDISSDFAEGDLKIQLKAESTPSNYIKGTGVIISKYVSGTGEFVAPNLRFLYMAGNASIQMYDDINDVVTISNVNTTSHYSNVIANVDDYDLNFAPETPLHVIEANPYSNLFNLYWRDYMNEIYSKTSRILEASFALDVIDVQSFSFSDRVWIKDSYWRILEIVDYKIGMNESTKVILIKTNNDQLDCTSVPYSSNAEGYIEFRDYDNNVVPPSSSCCERYGYVWNIGTQQCFGRGVRVNSPTIQTSVSGASDGVMTGQKTQPQMKIAMVTNSNVSIDNEWSTFVGKDITIEEGNETTTAQGDYLELKSGQPSSTMLGSNVIATIKGFHFGGGWRGARKDSEQGSQQTGVLVLGNSYIYPSSGSDIEVVVGNETITRLTLPNKTQWSCIMNIHLSDHDSFWAYGVYSFTIWYASGTAYASTPIQISIDDSIGNQFEVAPTIDVTTDPTKFRFKIELNDIGASPYTFPTPLVDVVATIQYTQSR
jgi:hypothetical protein